MAGTNVNTLIPRNNNLISTLPEATTVFVHGAETRLGLALLRLLLACPNVARVWATHVDFVPGVELQALALENPDQLGVVVMDPQREASVQWAADTVSRLSSCVELLINCVEGGDLEPGGSCGHGFRHPESAVAITFLESLSLTPLLIAKHFGRLLPASGRAIFASVTTHDGPPSLQEPPSEAKRMVLRCEQAVTRFLSSDLRQNNRKLVCATLEAHVEKDDDQQSVDDAVSAAASALLLSIDGLAPERVAADVSDVTPLHSSEPRRRA